MWWLCLWQRTHLTCTRGQCLWCNKFTWSRTSWPWLWETKYPLGSCTRGLVLHSWHSYRVCIMFQGQCEGKGIMEAYPCGAVSTLDISNIRKEKTYSYSCMRPSGSPEDGLSVPSPKPAAFTMRNIVYSMCSSISCNSPILYDMLTVFWWSDWALTETFHI